MKTESFKESLERHQRTRDEYDLCKQVERETVEDILEFTKDFTEYFTLAAFVRQYAKSRKVPLNG